MAGRPARAGGLVSPAALRTPAVPGRFAVRGDWLRAAGGLALSRVTVLPALAWSRGVAVPPATCWLLLGRWVVARSFLATAGLAGEAAGLASGLVGRLVVASESLSGFVSPAGFSMEGG